MRELIGFDGAVECLAANGPVNLVLRGFEMDAKGARSRHRAEAFFSGATTGAGALNLPPMLNGLWLFELAGPGPHRYLIRAQELQLELEAASMQLHRDAGREFFAAVPPPAVPWRLRFGWTLLLWLLRLPIAARLLSWLRGTR